MDNQAAVGEVDKLATDTTTDTSTATTDKAKATDTTAKATDTAKAGATDAKTEATATDAGKTADATSDAAKGEDDGKEVKGDWPEDWRERMAGSDEAFLRTLKRYSSPNTFAKGFKEREDTIRSGKLKQAKPDPTDEKAMAEWRKAEGIPETPEGYVFADTIKQRMTDADKPLMSNFTEYAHKQGAPQNFVDMAAGWYFDSMETIETERKAKDAQDAEALETSLRQEWGREYKGNYEMARRYLSSVPGAGQEWANAVLPDGRLLGNLPEFVQWAADQGRSTYGDAVFASSDGERKHTARREEIEKIRATDFERYEREYAAEYRKIIEKDLARGKR